MIAACRWHEPGGLAAAQTIVRFLTRIGIPVAARRSVAPSFVPSLRVRNGGILVDPGTKADPGDLLHEAGHIAVTDPALRPALSAIEADGGEEMAAMAWSVAAAHACGLPLKIVFHPDGYRGGSQSLIDAFAGGATIGVPLLACWGMCEQPAKWHAAPSPMPASPHMVRWLR